MPLFPALHREWKHLKIRTWIFILLGLLLAVAIFSVIFGRRQREEYRPAHTFNVSAPEFFGSAHALADPVPLHGNKITLLQNGDEIFPAMLEAIRSAKSSVNFEAYILYSDEIGHQFEEALMERAQAGVRVRIMLDGVGSSRKLNNSEVDLLRRKGCEFGYYHPALSLRVDRFDRRSHRRILVVDGKVGFTGGVGFAHDWSGHADSPEHWRDVHAKIEGPLVAKLQGAFQQHWIKVKKQAIAGEGEFPQLAPAGDLDAQVTASYSYSAAPLPLVQAVAMAAAERRIWITTPYCNPTHDQIDLLVTAVKRGVDVRLLTPGKHNDQPATKAAGRSSYGDLLRGGVKIYEFTPTMVHAKTMVVDSTFSVFGTSNLDARSAQLNEEIDVSVYNVAFGQQMETVFLKDLDQARPYTLQQFEARGVWERFSEYVMKPFQSQL